MEHHTDTQTLFLLGEIRQQTQVEPQSSVRGPEESRS